MPLVASRMNILVTLFGAKSAPQSFSSEKMVGSNGAVKVLTAQILRRNHALSYHAHVIMKNITCGYISHMIKPQQFHLRKRAVIFIVAQNF